MARKAALLPTGRNSAALPRRSDARGRCGDAGHGLQVDRPGQHDGCGLHVPTRRLHRDHRPPRDLPRHPPRPAGARQHRLPAVDDHGLSPRPGGHRRQLRPTGRHVRAGPDLQRGIRRLHGVVHPLVGLSVHRDPGCAVVDRLASRPSPRRLHADRQLRGNPDGCVPQGAARLRARSQPGLGVVGHVHRPGGGRVVGHRGLAVGLLGQRACRRLRNAVGLRETPRCPRDTTGRPDRLVGQRHLRRRTELPAGRRHVRHSALRGPRHGLDQPRRPCLARGRLARSWARSW